MESSLVKIALHLCLIILSLTGVSNVTIKQSQNKKQCDQIQLGSQWYKRAILVKKLGRPHNLAFHKPTQTILFVYSISNYYADVDFQIAHYNIITKTRHNVVDVLGGCAIAIDEKSDVVYLGGDDGIYKYNIRLKKSLLYKAGGINIWGLSFQKNLFYIKYPEQKLHVEVNGKFAAIKDFDGIEIDHFHVTAANEIYSANKSGIFKFNHETKSNARIILATARQIAEDTNGDVYFSTNKGLYKTANAGRRKISNVDYIFGFAFTATDKLIISDNKSIIMLTPTKKPCSRDADGKKNTPQKTRINKKKKTKYSNSKSVAVTKGNIVAMKTVKD